MEYHPHGPASAPRCGGERLLLSARRGASPDLADRAHMGCADRTVGDRLPVHRGPVRPLATEEVDFFAGDMAPSDHKPVVTTYAFDVDAAARAKSFG